MEYFRISHPATSDLGMSTLHCTVPDVSSFSKTQLSLHVILAKDAMGPAICSEKGVFSLAFGDSTLAMTFPSIVSCDKLPPSLSGSTTAVDETSSCNVNLIFNLGGNALRLLLVTDTPSSAGDFIRFFVVFVVLDVVVVNVWELFWRMIPGLPVCSMSSSKEKGSHGLSTRDIVQ